MSNNVKAQISRRVSSVVRSFAWPSIVPVLVFWMAQCTIAQNTCNLNTISDAQHVCDVATTDPFHENLGALALTCSKSKQPANVTCQELLPRINHSYCSVHLKLEIFSLIVSPFEKENECPDKKIVVDLHVRDFTNYVAPNSIDYTSNLFQVGAPGDIVSLRLENGLFNKLNETKSLSTKTLMDYIPNARSLELINLSGDTITGLRFGGDRFRLAHSRFESLPKDAIRAEKVKNFEMKSVKFSARKAMQTGSVVYQVPCSGRAMINVTDSIDLKAVESNPIYLYQDRAECESNEKLNLALDFTGNNFWPHAPESILGSILSTFLRDGVEMRLKLDRIECCLAKNRWLFAHIWKSTSKVSGFDIKCDDAKGDVLDYSSQASLEQTCDHRNKIPVYVIAIIVFVAFTVVLIAFCVVYRKYITPKRDDLLFPGSGTGTVPIPEMPSQTTVQSHESKHAATGSNVGSNANSYSGSNVGSNAGSNVGSNANSNGSQHRPITIVDARRKKRGAKSASSSSSSRKRNQKKGGSILKKASSKGFNVTR